MLHCRQSTMRCTRKLFRRVHHANILIHTRGFAATANLSDQDIIRLVNNSHPRNNITPSIKDKLNRKLHLQPNHPLNIIKTRIERYCNEYATQQSQSSFALYDDMPVVVSTDRCFDQLRVPPGHVSRSPSDTYYVDDKTVLRTHTSAHQTELISSGAKAFLCCGDVFRRDEIDATHYPVFHQMEGVRIFEAHELQDEQAVEQDLKRILTGLAVDLFGNVPMRWRDDYFPFTHPSFELEVLFRSDNTSSSNTEGTAQEKWIEVLGCGVIHPEVLSNAQQPPSTRGWAFGLGLERLAMILFGVPDIRLFWSTDERFLRQFMPSAASSGQPQQVFRFVPFSKFPLCYKDVSFWLPAPDAGVEFHTNYVCEIIREIAGDLVEEVQLFDEFTHAKTGRRSHAYRVSYRSMERSLTNAEIDDIQWRVREQLTSQLKVELR